MTISWLAPNPAACDGHTVRHRIDGGGLMQLYLGGVCGRVVTRSHFGHQSQARAQEWDVDESVNWQALQTLSNRIQYHVRKRLAAGKVPGRPVLPRALELARAGYALKRATQTPFRRWPWGPMGAWLLLLVVLVALVPYLPELSYYLRKGVAEFCRGLRWYQAGLDGPTAIRLIRGLGIALLGMLAVGIAAWCH